MSRREDEISEDILREQQKQTKALQEIEGELDKGNVSLTSIAQSLSSIADSLKTQNGILTQIAKGLVPLPGLKQVIILGKPIVQ